MIRSRSWLAWGGVIWFVTACGASSADPAARQVLDQWIESFNAGDPRQWDRFNAEHYPPGSPRNPGPDLAMRASSGGLDLVEIKESTPTRTVAILRERDGEGAAIQLTMEVAAAEPARIVRIDMKPSSVPVVVQPLPEAQLSRAVRAEIEKRVAADRFSGVVLIAKGDRVIFTDAFGEADRARHVANRPETRFGVGSMNKMFTAVSVLKLAQEGKIDLQAPIGKYLTDYPNRSFASKITIHQLLTHTGGAGDVFGPEFMERRVQLRTHRDYIDLYGKRDPTFEPGSQWAYSNYGFVLLGALIEKVSGQSYYDFVRENVYAPAGMVATGSEPAESAPANLAVGYLKMPGSTEWAPNTPTLPYRGTAAGGGYTTIGDLRQFANALLSHKLLNARYTELLTLGKVPAFGGKYAYGMIDREIGGVRTIGHGGSGPGISADLLMFPQAGYIVIVLANMDFPAAQRISEFIANRLPVR